MGRSIVPNLADHEVWFLTGSQTMYGDETLRQVAAQSQQVVDLLDGSAETRLSGRLEAGAHVARRDPAG